MHPIIKDLIVNILFILGPFFIFQLFWIEQKQIDEKKRWIYASVAASISMVLCMSYPVQFSEEWIFDLRQIPFILTALYFGYRAAAILLVVSLIYRYWVGGSGFYVVMLTHILMFIGIPLVRQYYKKLSQKWKPILTTAIAFVTLSFSFIFATILFGNDVEQTIHIWFYMVLISCPAIWITTYLIELSISNIKIRREIAKAEKANVVGQFAAAISHEVRNPLTVTKGFLQLLKDPLIPDGKKKRFIDLAVAELDHAESIISDYLMFAKPSLSKREKINTNKELKRIVDLITSYAKVRKVKIDWEVDSTAWIEGEPQLFHQCFVNVMKNGIEAMPNGGTLKLKVDENHDYVMIDIIDTGIGMTDEQIDRIGEPYYSTKENGTGLGMMVVCHILKGMRGKVEVESNVGYGTTMTIIFPKVSAPKLKENKIS